jgi:hypothetical protein
LVADDQADLDSVVRAFKQKRQGLVTQTAREIKNGVLSGANHRLKEAIGELLV